MKFFTTLQIIWLVCQTTLVYECIGRTVLKYALLNNGRTFLHPDCPHIADPKHPVHLPVENCSQFIHCDNGGVGHLKDCAPADPLLVFDPEVDRCVYQSETSREECNGSNSNTTNEPDSSAENETTENPAPTGPDPYPGCPFIADPKNPVHLPVENCNQFIHCDNGGVGYLKTCAPADPSIVFDPETNRCVHQSETSREECRGSNPNPTTSKPVTSPEATTTVKPEPTRPAQYPGCPLVADPKNPIHLPVENCNQFIHCDNGGVGHLKTCAPADPTIVFDPETNRCVHQSETSREECRGSNPNPTTSRPVTSPEATTTVKPEPTIPAQYPGCPLVADPKNPIHLPVENCNQFIHCDNGGAGHLKTCAPADPTIVFDPETNRCVHQSETSREECRGSNPNPTTSKPVTSPEATTTVKPEPTKPAQYPGCPLVVDPKNPMHLPVENCNQFIHCDNGGVGHLKTCAPADPTIVFDPETNRCVHQSETSRRECRGSDPNPTTSKPVTSPEATTTVKPEPTKPAQYPGCPLVADPKNPIHLPVENCNQFIHCDNGGVGHLKTCAPADPTIVFDPETNRCVHQSETSREECRGSNPNPTTSKPMTSPEVTTTVKPEPTRPAQYPGCPLVADPKNPIHLPVENCNQFIHCDNGGVGHLKTCAPADPTIVFDPETNRCVHQSETSREECRGSNPNPTTSKPVTSPEATTTLKPEPTKPAQYPGCPLVADPKNPIHLPVENCNQFIHCDNGGVGHLKTCAPADPTIVFDPETNRCVHQSETSREECRGTDSNSTAPAPEATTTVTPAPEPAPTANCPLRADPKNPLLLPVKNCNQFILCDNGGIGHLMDCAPSFIPLIFDPETQRCEYPYDTSRRDCEGAEAVFSIFRKLF